MFLPCSWCSASRYSYVMPVILLQEGVDMYTPSLQLGQTTKILTPLLITVLTYKFNRTFLNETKWGNVFCETYCIRIKQKELITWKKCFLSINVSAILINKTANEDWFIISFPTSRIVKESSFGIYDFWGLSEKLKVICLLPYFRTIPSLGF